MKRRTWIIAAAALAAVALGVGLAPRFGGESTEHRVRRYFPVWGALDTVSLREAVLRAVPIGSPESRLAWFADSTGLAADGASIYNPGVDDGTGLIRFNEGPGLDLVMESWIIVFEFDDARRLRDVVVRQALTGP